MELTKTTIKTSERILFVLFLGLTAWWVVLFLGYHSGLTQQNLLWAALYQVTALWGAICGFVICKHWGGTKSLIGRAILVMSIGLLLQNFGQTVFSIYNLVLKVDIPYPSIADIGFFASIPFYIYGVNLIRKFCVAKVAIGSHKNKTLAVLIPLIILVSSYFLFLRDYSFDFSNPIKIFLDFGYPFGQAIYISFAILVLIFSKDFLGGILKKAMLIILVALCVQYIADFNFLFQAGNGTWINGGYGDFLYLVAYTVMAYGIIRFSIVSQQIRSDSLDVSVPTIRPESSTSDKDKILNQIVVEIIQRQDRIAGQIAWEEAKKVTGLAVVDQAKGLVTLNGDPKKIIDQLVKGYQGIFGSLAADVSRNAAKYLVAELPDDQVPDSIR